MEEKSNIVDREMRPLEQANENLDSALNCLRAAVDELEFRLGPVLSPESETPMVGCAGDGKKNLSPLAEAQENRERRVAGLVDRVHSMLALLDLPPPQVELKRAECGV